MRLGIRLVLWSAVLGSAVAGCSVHHASAPGDTPPEARSTLARDVAPALSAAEEAAIERSDELFAFDLYAALAAGSSNVVVAPYSLSSVLAMAYAGARGTTADEIASALHFTLPPDRLHAAFDWLDLQIAQRAEQATDDNGRPFQLHAANSLWGDVREQFAPAFLDTLATDYGAGMDLADFAGNPDGSRVTINAWASDRTSGTVTDLIPPDGIRPTSRLLLVDAVYFDASWAMPFNDSATAPGTFTRTDGSTVQASMMLRTDTLMYAALGGYQAAELTYDGGQVAMDIVLPASGGDAQATPVPNDDAFRAVVAALQPTTVELHLPKFPVSGGSTSVAGALEGLGIHAAFDPAAADFGGITGGAGLSMQDVFHQAYVRVDEQGTEAAGGTGAVLGAKSASSSPTPMVVDHPFFFAIRDLPTGTVLFMGRIGDPTG